MPVATAALALVVVTALALPFVVAAQAPQRVLIRQVSQLDEDKGVRAMGQTYSALSAANVVYAQCATERGITDEQKKYLSEKFTSVSRSYVIAYKDAYVNHAQALPPQKLVDDVASSIAAQQQKAVNNTALRIRKKGCNDPRIKAMAEYTESLRQKDLADQNRTPVAPAAPY
jgi:hypothetical protein